MKIAADDIIDEASDCSVTLREVWAAFDGVYMMEPLVVADMAQGLGDTALLL